MKVELKSVSNARELGGYKTTDGKTVKNHVLLRTGRLDHLSDEDADILANTYHIGDVIDFRMNMEIVQIQVPNDAVYHHIDIIDTAHLTQTHAKNGLPEMSGEEFLQFINTAEKLGIFGDNMYVNFLENPVGQHGYREFFKILLHAENAVLWHCTSGKDRTGLAAMLILSALGVDEQTILSDYLLTNTFNAEKIRRTHDYFLEKTNDEVIAQKAVLLIDGVSPVPMLNVLAHLKNNYHSVQEYINHVLGISYSEIDFLKEKFLI